MKSFTFVFLLILILSSSVFADMSYMEPASVLVYPYYSTGWGNVTILSVTNVNTCMAYNPNTNSFYGDLYVTFYYVDGVSCDVTNIREFLSPGDTLTVNVAQHNPSSGGIGGWVYAIAMNPFTLRPMSFDSTVSTPAGIYQSGLIGKAVVGNGIFTHVWSIPAIGIKTEPGMSWGDNIDLNNNGKIEVANELEALPSKLYISDFFEIGYANCNSMLVLLALQVPDVEVRMKYLFYNNDELKFSRNDEFECWMAKTLDDISPVASNLIGAPAWAPTGWVEMWVDKGVNLETGQIIPRNQVAILGAHVYLLQSPAYFTAELLHHSDDALIGGVLDF